MKANKIDHRRDDGKNSYLRGRFYEGLAVCLLRSKGYAVIGRNLRGRRGTSSEIDIIAVKGDILVFAEVKYRKRRDDTYTAITEKSKQRIINAASLFVAAHPEYADYEIRFDAVLFSGLFTVEHIKEAFRP